MVEEGVRVPSMGGAGGFEVAGRTETETDDEDVDDDAGCCGYATGFDSEHKLMTNKFRNFE